MSSNIVQKIKTMRLAHSVSVGGTEHTFVTSERFDMTREGSVFIVIHKTSNDTICIPQSNVVQWSVLKNELKSKAPIKGSVKPASPEKGETSSEQPTKGDDEK